MAHLHPGTAAPHFTLDDQDGAPVSLNNLRGRAVIVYFYPAAMTSGCTTQACDFGDSLGAFTSAGYTVVGVSRDAPDKLREFRERDHITFPLLSDPDHAVHDAYGAWGEKSMYGKVVTGAIRATFVIDEDGILTHALYNVKATGHVARLREVLGIA